MPPHGGKAPGSNSRVCGLVVAPRGGGTEQPLRCRVVGVCRRKRLEQRLAGLVALSCLGDRRSRRASRPGRDTRGRSRCLCRRTLGRGRTAPRRRSDRRLRWSRGAAGGPPRRPWCPSSCRPVSSRTRLSSRRRLLVHIKPGLRQTDFDRPARRLTFHLLFLTSFVAPGPGTALRETSGVSMSRQDETSEVPSGVPPNNLDAAVESLHRATHVCLGRPLTPNVTRDVAVQSSTRASRSPWYKQSVE